MREIIHISAGQCGNQIGNAFWETISDEHGIGPHGERLVSDVNYKDNLDVYYAESNNRYVPRSVMVDLEPATIDSIKNGKLGGLFRPDNYINALSSAGNIWAKGFYTDGSEIAEQVLDVVRREAEQTESLQGFQLTHSLGGGTGSGLGTLLLSKLREEYSDKMIASYSVFPSQNSDTVVEPYNSVMALSQLLENANETFCLDNHALYSIFQKNLKIEHPTYDNLNGLVAQVMSGVTTSLRYPGQLNSDLRKLAVNLVPFSRLHFFTVGYSPLVSENSQKFSSLSVPELTQQILDGRNLMAQVDPSAGKYLTCGAYFRGKVGVKEIEDEMSKYRARHNDLFVDFIPDNVQTSLCTVPPKNVDMTATFIANTTAVNQLFDRIRTQFTSMFRRRAFLHWYTSEGMDINEFTEAEFNLSDLIRDYQQHETGMSTDYDAPLGEEIVYEEMQEGEPEQIDEEGAIMA